MIMNEGHNHFLERAYMKRLWTWSIGAALAMGLTAPVSAEPASDYNPAEQARIRLFGQNGKPTIMTSGIDCEQGKKGEKVNVGGGLGDAFGSFVGTAKNKSIGIPETETTRHLAEQNGILSKALYKEFVIPSNKSVNVQAAYIGLTTVATDAQGKTILYEGSCSSGAVSFVPQAGRDYEVISLKQGANCGVAVAEVVSSGTAATLQLVPTAKPVVCGR